MGLRSDDKVTVNNSTGNRQKAEPVGEIATGMNSIFWGIRNPFRSGLRGFGFLCATLGCLTVVAGGIYWMRGDTTPASLSAHPGDIGRWFVDKGARPIFNPIFQSDAVRRADEWLYRQPGQQPEYSNPEDLYRPETSNTVEAAAVE